MERWVRSIRFLLLSHHRTVSCPWPSPCITMTMHIYPTILSSDIFFYFCLSEKLLVWTLRIVLCSTFKWRGTCLVVIVFSSPRAASFFLDFSPLFSDAPSPLLPLLSSLPHSVPCSSPYFTLLKSWPLETVYTMHSLRWSLFYPLSCDHPRVSVSLILKLHSWHEIRQG